MVRYLLLALAAVPLLVLLSLLPSTPITLAGAFYLLGYALVVSALIGAPWWPRLSPAIFLVGSAILPVTIALRVLFPPSGSSTNLITLPGGVGPRWLNRIFDERDIVILGARAAQPAGLISAAEKESLFPALRQKGKLIRQVDQESPAGRFERTAFRPNEL